MNSMQLNPIWLITGLLWIAAITALAFVLRRRSSRPFEWMSRSKRAALFALTILSLVLCLLGAATSAGYANSPEGMLDSEGHALGFGQPICWELWRSMLANASPSAIADELMGWYGVVFVGMHVLALAMFAGAFKLAPRQAVMACCLQLFLFLRRELGLLAGRAARRNLGAVGGQPGVLEPAGHAEIGRAHV